MKSETQIKRLKKKKRIDKEQNIYVNIICWKCEKIRFKSFPKW